MRANLLKTIKFIKIFDKIIYIYLLSILLFIFAARYDNFFTKIMSVATFLTWHSLFEFASALASFSIFIVSYYIYEESRSLRMIILGCSFLAMGILDAFHTLSYKGMADFFISNYSANRATTFWILSRAIGSMGFLIAVLIPVRYKCNLKKLFFVIPVIIIVIVLLILVTYYPEIFPPMFIEGQGLTIEKIYMEYIIVILMFCTLLKIAFEYIKDNSRQHYLYMIALVLSIFSEFSFISYSSVYDIYNYLGHLYKIIAYFILFNAIYGENVRVPYQEMKKARNELKEYSENLNFIVKQRTKELEDMNGILLTDLEYAKEMQRSLLPAQMPCCKFVSFAAEYLPAERLSGDFYNVIKLDESNIAIYIGDVSGHGVSAAMLTVYANQNIKPLKEYEQTSEIISPGYVIKSIYKDFNNTNFKSETYIVMVYGIYNIKNRSFIYSSAGINVPPLIIRSSGKIEELDVRGFPICKLGDYFMPYFEDRKIELEPGDKILFYTDGLVEARNDNGFIYGQQTLISFLRLNNSLDSNNLKAAIKNNLFQHIGHADNIMDDATFLILEVN